ncbi:MAG: trypsin-like peptidase domain-containing protein [Desulfotomaculaceae bacterium]|nr:trypsin-like peptidase domain-containing protein [Desulfotomaculaceae bacterium]
MLTNWRRSLLFIAVVAFTVGIMFTGGCNFDRGNLSGDQGKMPASADSLPGIGPDAVAEVVSSSGPAVVKISTQKASSAREMDPFFSDPFFRQFFGQPYAQRQQEEGLGSGFIISGDGYILTNEHVIDGAEKIYVIVSGHENAFEASVTGADYDLDLALLKINAQSELPFLSLGNSDQIRVGNWVIAIGNPMVWIIR